MPITPDGTGVIGFKALRSFLLIPSFTTDGTGVIGFEVLQAFLLIPSFTTDGTGVIDFNASRSSIPDNKPRSGLIPITAVSSAVKYIL